MEEALEEEDCAFVLHALKVKRMQLASAIETNFFHMYMVNNLTSIKKYGQPRLKNLGNERLNNSFYSPFQCGYGHC
ncbi:MAG: hypothetical protein ACOX7N_04340 [Lawsonibacter sp.]